MIVRGSGRITNDGRDIMPGLPQTAHGVERVVFVSEEVHGSSSAAGILPLPQGKAALLSRGFGGVSEDGQEIISFQVGIVVQDLVLGPARGEQPQQEFHREPRAPDDRFAREDLGFRVYAIPPVHSGMIILAARASPCGSRE